LDGKTAAFELVEEPMGYRVVHTPAKPLDPKAPHTARIAFNDDTGPQAFEWIFGAPAAPVATVLLASDTLGGTPVPVTDARLDPATRTFRVPLSGTARFFRVADPQPRRWIRTEIQADQLLLTYQ
jgi:hypothetical protein